ncbi:MAG: hypothetical protein AAGB06_01615, partial [Verrucomicrobiota bacterium]
MNTICTLGIGEKFLEMGISCLISARIHSRQDYRFVIFCGEDDLENNIDIPEFIEVKTIDEEIA